MILFIGDLHFKLNNNAQTNVIITKTLELLTEHTFRMCVLGGDILDTHERLHQTPFNKAISFISEISKKCPKTFILVGNHDYENNSQFLSHNHWMNCLKEWKNIVIVDKVISYDNMLFCPYVPPGRFIEALNTVPSWKQAICIFAHQELRGCVMGLIKSVSGDIWQRDWPLVVSGHIHTPQRLQDNIVYPGSIIQHNFGEEKNKGGFFFINYDLLSKKEYTADNIFKTVSVNIPSHRTVYCDSENLKQTIAECSTSNSLERTKIVYTGIRTKCVAPVGITVVYKPVSVKFETVFDNFDDLMIKQLENNLELMNLYREINFGVNNFESLF
nr:MAG: DNA repair exonuclease [Diabrotica toursvirus 3a]